jgi:hypothetical protein
MTQYSYTRPGGLSLSFGSSATVSESVREAWDSEVALRMEELRTGKALTVAWQDLHRELLAIVNER